MIYYPRIDLDAGGDNAKFWSSPRRDQWQFQQFARRRLTIRLRLEYAAQPSPGGLARLYPRARIRGADSVALALGDNIFYGHGLPEIEGEPPCVREARPLRISVRDPERYGVVEFTPDGAPSTWRRSRSSALDWA